MDMSSMSKGVSPIVAGVLMVAVTLSAATIFSGWGPDITRSVTDAVTNQTSTAVNCNSASLRIDSAHYWEESDPSETSVVISNTGNEDLDSVQVSAWLDNLPVDDTTVEVNRGNFTTVNITTDNSPDFVRAESMQCSDARDEHEDIS